LDAEVFVVNDTTSEFPVERAFLELAQELADASSKRTDRFCAEAGKSLPQTMDATGTVLSRRALVEPA
jgi:hypothetical protein